MPGRSEAEGGNEVKEHEEEVRRVENEVIGAIQPARAIESTTGGDVANAVQEMESAETSSGGGVAEEPFHHVGEIWECSQVGNEFRRFVL